MCRACVCLLRRLPVAKFGQRKAAVTHLCTFDRLSAWRNREGQWWEVAIVGGRCHGEGVFGVCFEGDLFYCSTYVGIVFRSLIFKTSNFNPSTSKFIVITTSTMLRQLKFRYKDSVRDPQTLQPLKSWASQLSLHVLLVWGVTQTSLLIKMCQSWGFELRYDVWLNHQKNR